MKLGNVNLVDWKNGMEWWSGVCTGLDYCGEIVAHAVKVTMSHTPTIFVENIMYSITHLE